VLVPQRHTAGRSRARRSGGNFLVEAEVFFDSGDADFELEPFVDFALLELVQVTSARTDLHERALWGDNRTVSCCGALSPHRPTRSDWRAAAAVAGREKPAPEDRRAFRRLHESRLGNAT
jgi:hypothetical protein